MSVFQSGTYGMRGPPIPERITVEKQGIWILNTSLLRVASNSVFQN
jgi:hypothetical protein